MWNQKYNKKDFTLKFSYRINDEPWTEDEQVSCTQEDIVTEDKFHFIDFRDFRHKGSQLEEKDAFEVRVKNPSENQFCYVYNGYPDYYKEIVGQEWHFCTEYSYSN